MRTKIIMTGARASGRYTDDDGRMVEFEVVQAEGESVERFSERLRAALGEQVAGRSTRRRARRKR